MNHAQEINKLIELSAKRPDFAPKGFQPYENQASNDLFQVLNKANLFFTCSVLGMEAVSHVIEDQALTLGGKFEFYTAFQKMSRLRPQKERYRRLSQLGQPINLFGIIDTEVWNEPNLNFIRLEKPVDTEPSLSQNWFVILNNPQFVSMALVGRELPPNNRPVGAPNKLVYRNFEGFWTYDKDIIGLVVSILENYIEEHNSLTKTSN